MKLPFKQFNQLLAKLLAVVMLTACCSLSLPAGSQTAISADTQQNVLALMIHSNLIQDPEAQRQFEADMSAFQRRAEGHLDASEIVNTYIYVNKLFDDNEKAVIKDPATRVKLAEQIMHQAADPTSIDQGQHPACAGGAMETRNYTRSPGEVAQMLHQVAATGSFTADGITVNLDAQSLQQDQESTRFKINKADDDSCRSYASKLFLLVCCNLYLKEIKSPLEYRQLTSPEFYGDTGSRIFDPRTGQSRLVNGDDFRSALMSADRMYFLTTGKHETKFSIIGGKYGAPGAYSVKTAADLHYALSEIQKANLFPAAIEVQTKNEPFKSDAPMAASSWHEVTAVDYDPKSGYVSIDNQWGRKNDHLGIWGGKDRVLYTVLIDAINDAAHATPLPVPLPVPLTHRVKRPLGRTGN